jgi:xylulokinase
MYLGIDIGTSSVKAVLVGEDGVLAGQASAALAVSRPRPLWSEQDPDDWWRATQDAVTALDARLRARVVAVGLSGQMHGATLLGADDRPLRPAILWNDGRSGAQCAALETGVPDLPSITGNRAMPGFTAPKLMWVRDEEPEIFAATRRVLLPKDYVRLRMTGDAASDLSDSAGTLWLDTGARRWSARMLAACGLDERTMPALHEGTEATGVLRADVSQGWGMNRVPVAAGGGDNAAGAIGIGALDPGEGFVSLGTSGVIFVADDRYRPDPTRGLHTFCHALPDRWHQMAVILNAASAIDWAAGTCGFGDAAALIAAAESRNRASGRELFLPYLTGERTPHNDPHATGAWFGLTADTDRAALAQAALEGVTLALAEGYAALAATGVRVEALSLIGGGSRSRYWARLIASALGVPMVLRTGGEVGPAFGAARLAALAAGAGTAETLCPPPPETGRILPDEHWQAHFATQQPRFAGLYSALHPLFQEISA